MAIRSALPLAKRVLTYHHGLNTNNVTSKRALFLPKTRFYHDDINLTVSHARPLLPFWFGQLIILPGEAGRLRTPLPQPSKPSAPFHREVSLPPPLAPIPLNHSHVSSGIMNCVAASCCDIPITPFETLWTSLWAIADASTEGILFYLRPGGAIKTSV